MVYCDRCDRHFVHDSAFYQHERDSDMHHVCYSCDIDFASSRDRNDHLARSSLHHYCEDCNTHFSSEEEHSDHMNDAHIVQRFDCHCCGEIFENFCDLDDHREQDHFYCHPCNRIFESESNLTHHVNSSLHQPRNVQCPGRGCQRAFVTVSALTQHFESGTCASGLTRAQLNAEVVRADRNNYVTNPQRLLGGPQGYEAPLAATGCATVLAFNGAAFECFLCHATFGSLHGLNSHLASPRHDERIYRCPNALCGGEYSVLSGLCQHVERGNCGVRRFREVQSVMDGLASGARLLAY
ncbi:hypothetical protein FA95DRAFT_1588426 [Auriscalpium vulgare]|uniref:Uncharacterized protein n=1 Tax=Auriscalpium vulgare TaxID=40419 RepID=A0ACB8RYE2_9AGAM|nr:hypothetical protein FA95DRAFT_1588426 [Auriscalpium vulgare]